MSRVAHRRAWRALLVALVAFFVAGPGPALAAWKQPFAGALNVDASDGAGAPSIANVGGVPYAAWNEGTIRVAARGTNGWSAVGGSLNSHGDGHPRIANVGGVPYVAWNESSGTSIVIRVARFTGGAWSAVGGSLNVDARPVRLRPNHRERRRRPVCRFGGDDCASGPA